MEKTIVVIVLEDWTLTVDSFQENRVLTLHTHIEINVLFTRLLEDTLVRIFLGPYIIYR